MPKTISLSILLGAGLIFQSACSPAPPAGASPAVPAQSEEPSGRTPPAETAGEPAASRPSPPPVTGSVEPYVFNAVDSLSQKDEIVLTRDKLAPEEIPDSKSGRDDAQSGRFRNIQGYRIQVFASTNFKDAEKKKEDLLSALEAPVYVIYEEPFYKIRMGNFEKEDEAKELKKKLVEMGNDAWIVQSPVRVKKK